jgi:creatinine amidohydrolase
MAAERFWTDLAWPDFQARDMAKVIAVLPLAAVEQHGPHLPVSVDSAIMDGYLARVVERLPDDLPALFLPVQRIGASIEHEAFPGTLSLSFETAARAWIEIGASVRRTGCRKLVLLNSHGGNVAVMEAVARELRARHGMFVVNASWHRFGYPDGLFSDAERAHGIHGGDVETSLMMAFEPDSVREGEIADFPSAGASMEREFAWLGAVRPIGFGWMSQDLSESGAMGDASAATPHKGESAADYGATAFIELLRDVEAFDLERLAEGPLSEV